jgi:hypothetical protein
VKLPVEAPAASEENDLADCPFGVTQGAEDDWLANKSTQKVLFTAAEPEFVILIVALTVCPALGLEGVSTKVETVKSGRLAWTIPK